MIVAINKYDIPYQNGEGLDEIKNYVKDEILKACKACGDDTLVKILEQADPIPFSAEMALLSELPMSKITSNDAFQHAWKRTCDIFEISSQEQMRKESYLDKAERRLNKKIDTLGDEIHSDIYNIIRTGKNSLEDQVDITCEKMINLVETWKRFDSIDVLNPKLEREIDKLKTRTLIREFEDLGEVAKKMIKRSISDFLNDIEVILMKYLPDFEWRDYIRSINSKIQFDIDNKEMSPIAGSSGNNRLLDASLHILDNFTLGPIFSFLDHAANRKELNTRIDLLRREFDPKPFLESIYSRKDLIITTVKDAFLRDLIEPMQEQIKDIRSQKGKKDSKLEEAKTIFVRLKEAKETISKQIEEVNQNR